MIDNIFTYKYNTVCSVYVENLNILNPLKFYNYGSSLKYFTADTPMVMYSYSWEYRPVSPLHVVCARYNSNALHEALTICSQAPFCPAMHFRD